MKQAVRLGGRLLQGQHPFGFAPLDKKPDQEEVDTSAHEREQAKKKASSPARKRKLPDEQRVQRHLGHARRASLAEDASRTLGAGFVRELGLGALASILCVLRCLFPVYKRLFEVGWGIQRRLPTNVLLMLAGVALCFFGGTYAAAIAAIEAFRQMGWARVRCDLAIVLREAQLIAAASEVDDEVDDDGDGRPDVADLPPAELAQRKVSLAMTTVKEPRRLQQAIGSLWAAYLAVIATLQLTFARTTALALGIVEMLRPTLVELVAPAVSAALGTSLGHWTQTLIEATFTFVAVVLAWMMQSVISALYSGMRGGRLFASALLALLEKRGLLEHLPFVTTPFDPNESHVDEVLAYSLAAAGFMFQISTGFALPFPLNLLLFPLTIVEWFLRLQITIAS